MILVYGRMPTPLSPLWSGQQSTIKPSTSPDLHIISIFLRSRTACFYDTCTFCRRCFSLWFSRQTCSHLAYTSLVYAPIRLLRNGFIKDDPGNETEKSDNNKKTSAVVYGLPLKVYGEEMWLVSLKKHYHRIKSYWPIIKIIISGKNDITQLL